MDTKKPIKRDKSMRLVSRDHRHGLLLCWKIRTQFSKGVHELRIKKYADGFYYTYLIPDFKLEEQHIRFEERVLFNEIQKITTEKQMETISKLQTDEKFNENTDDLFWI